MSNLPLYLRKRCSRRFDSLTKARLYSRGPMAGTPTPSNPWEGMSTGWAVTSYLVGGLLAFGAIGYVIDWLFVSDAPFTAVREVSGVFTGIGAILGAALAIYLIYLRFGAEHDDK
jgi:hypothetical protein